MGCLLLCAFEIDFRVLSVIRGLIECYCSDIGKIFDSLLTHVTVTLQEAATTLSQIEQPLVTETVSKKKALKLLEAELRPLKKSIIKHDLLKNRDNDVSLLVTVCVSEIFRILAPEPPFEDKYLRV